MWPLRGFACPRRARSVRRQGAGPDGAAAEIKTPSLRAIGEFQPSSATSGSYQISYMLIDAKSYTCLSNPNLIPGRGPGDVLRIPAAGS